MGWGYTRRREEGKEGTQLGQLAQVITGIIYNMWHPGRGEGRLGLWELGCLSSWYQLFMIEPCFPGDSRPPPCLGQVVTEYLVLLGLCKQLLFHLLNCLYLNLWVFSLVQFPPHPTIREWVSEQLWEVELLANHSNGAHFSLTHLLPALPLLSLLALVRKPALSLLLSGTVLEHVTPPH